MDCRAFPSALGQCTTHYLYYATPEQIHFPIWRPASVFCVRSSASAGKVAS
jgi:hypothetical protein